MKIKFVFTIVLICSLCLQIAAGQSASVFPENAWGVHSWTQFTGLTKQNAPHAKGGPMILHWSKLEPQKGVFKFETEIGAKLKTLEANDFYCFLIVWVAPAASLATGDTAWSVTPKWLFRNGVPLVEFDERLDPLGKVDIKYYPYYFDEDYKFYYHRMISELGKYIKTLSPALRSRILYIQSAEGATGDGGPYKGDPLNSIYNITSAQWADFRLDAFKSYKEALTQDGKMLVPLLTNDDSNTEKLRNWMLAELPNAIGVKNGMFSHGYQISDAQERVASHIELKNKVEAAGKVFFSRGEQDAELFTHKWSTQNIAQGLYWSGIYATHCGLWMWNIPTDAIKGETYATAIKFFNKYAAQTNPSTAKGAFCAFYRGLDASDMNDFPVSKFGAAEKKNQQRYVAICNEFKQFGAGMADPAAATGGGMVNRKASGYNDAGWKILTTNFQRHITQIDAEATSDAWWQLDATVYGRFARGFNPSIPAKNTMYFNLDDQFLGTQPLVGSQSLDVSITYLDSDAGSWELLYDAADGTMKSAMTVTNTGTGTAVWKTKTVNITDAYLQNRGSKGADFMLVNKGGTNCRFHMIAVDKVGFATGLSDISQEKQSNDLVEIYPNPANDVLHFNFKNNGSDKTIRIINTVGQEVFNGSTKENTFKINVKALKCSGLVIVRTDVDNSVQTKKIMVAN